MPTEEGLIQIQSGKLVHDATCAPTDLAYLFDVRMLQQTRL